MERRNFLRNSAIAAASLAIPWLIGCTGSGNETAIARPDFLQHALDQKTLTEIGNAYRKLFPEEGNRSKLVSLLLEAHPSSQASDSASLYTYFESQVANDFSADHVVVVKGWILSKTEARQCALFSLLPA